VFFRLPEVDGSNADLVAQTAVAVGEFGDVLSHLRQAWADKRITVEEAARIAQEGRESIAAIASLIKSIEQKAEPAAGPRKVGIS
jgi:hypothetical protein